MRDQSQWLSRTLFVMVGVLLLVTTSAATRASSTQAAEQTPTCPSGWSTQNLGIRTISLACKQSFFWGPDGWLIRAPSQHVGQHVELPGSPCTFMPYHQDPTNPNPELVRRSVSQWVSHLRGLTPECSTTVADAAMVINGTFFEPGAPAAALAYPVRYHNLMVTGVEPDLDYDRRCMAYGGGGNPMPGAFHWGANEGWFNVQTWFTTPPSMGFGCEHWPTVNQTVGMSPYAEVSKPGFGLNLPRTYLGYSENHDVCILVGGSYPPTSAIAALHAIDCTEGIQLDGGVSSQMSYWNGTTVIDAVPGWNPLGQGEMNRPVPHIIFIYES